MQKISIEKIKILREKTGAGFLECKNALLKNNSSVDESINFLRKKGNNYNLKKLSKEKYSSIIYLLINDIKKTGIILELAAETDFVVKTNDFSLYAKVLAEKILNDNNFKENSLMTYEDICDNLLIKEECLKAIQKFKENVIVNKIKKVSTHNGFLFGYIHNVNNYGKIGTIITLDREYNNFLDIIKDLAMHIIAMNPQYLTIYDIPESILLNEKNIYLNMVKEKYPDKNITILNQIIDNNINNFYKNNVLLNQPFVKDNKININKFINDRFKVLNFIRLESSN